MSKNYEKFMQIAIDLAKNGEGKVWPNPMVGSVIVDDSGEIIGKGYHQEFGQAHAEIEAINSVADSNRESLNNATIYVNLEPCCHYGKTPPCVDTIIKSGIKRVVIANIDPNPKMKGKGIKILEDNGIEVIIGVLEEEGSDLNKRFVEMFTSS